MLKPGPLGFSNMLLGCVRLARPTWISFMVEMRVVPFTTTGQLIPNYAKGHLPESYVFLFYEKQSSGRWLLQQRSVVKAKYEAIEIYLSSMFLPWSPQCPAVPVCDSGLTLEDFSSPTLPLELWVLTTTTPTSTSTSSFATDSSYWKSTCFGAPVLFENFRLTSSTYETLFLNLAADVWRCLGDPYYSFLPEYFSLSLEFDWAR